jgi:hypothetical protein
MIHYYIPDFFWHYNANLRLLELMRDEPQMFYDDFKIGAVFGNFPNCIWNGGRSWNGRHVDVNEQRYISEQFNSFGVPLRLTMTNLLLKETDIYDRFANYIMQNLHNGFNQVLVADEKLEKYIRKTYPDYPVVRSILASEEVFYDDSDKYYMSVFRKQKNTDFELLQSIKNKGKIEILVNETCPIECEMYHHYRDLSKSQLYEDNRNEALYLDCPYNRKYERKTFYDHPYCITREKIKEVYEPMGFKHFKISGRGPYYKNLILDYAHYMVKPEWKEDFIVMMLDAVIADSR